MDYELDCKWHFAQLGDNAGDEGPNSAMSQTFAQFPSAALIRESIQNSLDAAISEEPVKVCYEFRSLEREDYKNFFQLSKHTKLCKEYYKNNKSAIAIYPKMSEYLDTVSSVGFIRVSDYNTRGMDYAKDETDKTFYAFVRAAGVSVKQADGAGGSFGFGKGAFFVMSPLNTLFVSTKTIDGECYFEGVTRLCTHSLEGKKCSHMGFYDNNNGQPVSEENKIPLPFKRTESGTSIGIMGIDYKSWHDSKSDLVKEVLRNFFVAILRKKLIVIVDGDNEDDKNAIVINDINLKKLMQEYFPDTQDLRRKKTFNPRPYYEAMTDSEIKPFSADLPVLGNVQLYIKEFPENVTQFIFLRKLLMKVYRSSRGLGNYNGVFICENEVGNKILCDMEDPEHKSWDPAQCNKDEIKTDYKIAHDAEKEINDFINNCIDELLNLNNAESLQVAELEKYLPSNDDLSGKGEKGNPFTGHPSGKYINDGVSLTTEGTLKPEINSSKKRRGNVAEIESGDFQKNENGTEIGGTGGENHGQGGDHKVPGDNYDYGVIENGDGSFKHIIEVDWRPVVSIKKGFTDILIYSPKELKGAELHFKIGRERNLKEEKEDVSIIKSSSGIPEGLTIKNVPLRANSKNIIQISFSDNMSHSLILEVYENY